MSLQALDVAMRTGMPGDYLKAVQRIWATPQQASFIDLPVASGTLP